jgi:hypothetical protein
MWGLSGWSLRERGKFNGVRGTALQRREGERRPGAPNGSVRPWPARPSLPLLKQIRLDLLLARLFAIDLEQKSVVTLVSAIAKGCRKHLVLFRACSTTEPVELSIWAIAMRRRTKIIMALICVAIIWPFAQIAVIAAQAQYFAKGRPYCIEGV